MYKENKGDIMSDKNFKGCVVICLYIIIFALGLIYGRIF